MLSDVYPTIHNALSVSVSKIVLNHIISGEKNTVLRFHLRKKRVKQCSPQVVMNIENHLVDPQKGAMFVARVHGIPKG